jgi:hypothetical protein
MIPIKVDGDDDVDRNMVEAGDDEGTAFVTLQFLPFIQEYSFLCSSPFLNLRDAFSYFFVLPFSIRAVYPSIESKLFSCDDLPPPVARWFY